MSSLKKPGFLIVRLKLPEWFICKNPVFGLFSVESTLSGENGPCVRKIGPISREREQLRPKLILSEPAGFGKGCVSNGLLRLPAP